MKTSLWLVFLILLTLNLLGQTKVITYSPVDGIIDKSVPFDEPFILRIPYTDEPVIKIEYFDLINKKDIMSSLAQRTVDALPDKFQPKIIEAEYIENKTVEKQKYSYISFKYPNLLKSGKEYGIIVRKNLPDELVYFLFDYFNTTEKPNRNTLIDEILIKRKSIFKSYIADIQYKGKDTKIPLSLKYKAEYFKDPIFQTELDSYLQKYVKTEFENLASDFQNISLEVSNSKIAENNNLSNINYPTILNIRINNIESANYFNDSTSFRKAMVWFRYNRDLSKLMSGEIKLYDTNSSSDLTIQKRRNNLEITLNELQTISAQINYLANNYSGFDLILTDLNALIISISKNYISTMTAERRIKELKSILSKNKFNFTNPNDKKTDTIEFDKVEFYELNSFIGSIATKHKFMITPTASYSYLNPMNIKSDSHTDLSFRHFPSLGFSFVLKPINRDITFNTYDKNLFQIISIDLGWSLVNFSQEGKYDNYFENSTFFTGLGFRFNNTFRAQAGLQWLNEIDKIQNKRNVLSIPTISLSIDLVAKDLFNGFFDIIGGQKSNIINNSIKE